MGKDTLCEGKVWKGGVNPPPGPNTRPPPPSPQTVSGLACGPYRTNAAQPETSKGDAIERLIDLLGSLPLESFVACGRAGAHPWDCEDHLEVQLSAEIIWKGGTLILPGHFRLRGMDPKQEERLWKLYNRRWFELQDQRIDFLTSVTRSGR